MLVVEASEEDVVAPQRGSLQHVYLVKIHPAIKAFPAPNHGDPVAPEDNLNCVSATQESLCSSKQEGAHTGPA